MHLKLNFVAVLSGLLSAVIVSLAFASPAFADWQSQRTLANNCGNVRFSADSEMNVLFDPESGIVRLEVFGPGNSENSMMLPYRPETNFSGCSQDAKALLVRVKEDQEKYVSDMCQEMTAIVSGEKSLPQKGGIKAHMNGAIEFVKKHCSK